MNKAELIEALAVHVGGNKAEAGRMLNLVLETIMQETARHQKVGITGFGVFETVYKDARVVRNPRTGERTWADPVHQVRFRAGSAFKACLAPQEPAPPGGAEQA